MKLLSSCALLALVASALPATARADCSVRGTMVTYYSEPDQSIFSGDKRCTMVRALDGTYVCRVRMRGVFYRASTLTKSDLPAIIWNHGSEHTFQAIDKSCSVAEFFVPLGYHVFVPFRRGHGEIPEACLEPEPADPCEDRPAARKPATQCPLGNDESTGTYITQAYEAYKASCGSGCNNGAYKNQLFDEQVEDVVEAFNWLKARSDVADNEISIAGSSYGGIMTTLTNARSAGLTRSGIGVQSALVFSPGAISWASDDGTQNVSLQDHLKQAAAAAKAPAYFLQGRYDHDTRAATELAYAYAYGGTDDLHMRPFNLGIFDYPLPPTDACTGDPDWQSVHTGFVRATSLWGPSIIDFLDRTSGK
jgi:dienelactone hydrolase